MQSRIGGGTSVAIEKGIVCCGPKLLVIHVNVSVTSPLSGSRLL